MKTTIKTIFESDNWIITNISQGCGGKVRIDAKTRFYKADQSNQFSEWCSEKYANRISIENYGKKVNELRAYSY
jgi:hypothetical protein